MEDPERRETGPQQPQKWPGHTVIASRFCINWDLFATHESGGKFPSLNVKLKISPDTGASGSVKSAD